MRNLAFTCSAEALREAFEPHGVVEASVPMRPNGKHPGFGFVQMSSRAACDAAIAGLNEQKIGGRMVAVDFALSKTAYERAVGAPAAPKEAAAAAPPPKAEAVVAAEEEEEATTTTTTTTLTIDDDDDGSDDEADEADDEDEDDDDDDGDDDDEDDDGRCGRRDAEEEEEEETAAGRRQKPAAKPAKAAPAAADGDRSLEATIFVRGVPLSCDEPELHDAFQRYGKLQYCRVVRDPATGLSRGSAFVCYNAVGHAQLALAAASGGRGPTIHGQPLTLSAATSRQGAAELARSRQEGHGKGESKRNLHLARLGLAQAGDAAAEGMPRAELQKREGAWAQKKQKLASPNFAVSSTRLSVRNLPPSIDEKALAAAALAACATARKKHGQPRLKQVKLVRDEERRDRTGQPRSRGFGFVEFDRHEHSLAALKRLGDNPDALADHGAKGRWLIVEFAVDNVQKLRLHELRRQRSSQPPRAERNRAEEEGKAAADGAGGDGEADGGGGDKKAAAAARAADREAPRRRRGAAAAAGRRRAVARRRRRRRASARARPRRRSRASASARRGSRRRRSRRAPRGARRARRARRRTMSGWCSNTARRSRGPSSTRCAASREYYGFSRPMHKHTHVLPSPPKL